MNHFHSLRIDSVEHEPNDAIVLKFGIPEPMKAVFAYTQGQHLTLRAWINGKEFRRSYSICSAIQDKDIKIAVKRIPGGIFSEWVHANIKPNAVIDVMPPTGNFNVPLEEHKYRHFLGIAAGSGITPILGIIKTTLLAEPSSHFTLVFGNRTSSSVMFREELAALKDRYIDRFNMVNMFSRERQDVDLFNGRITREKCEALFGTWLSLDNIDYVFICGPELMMFEACDALLNSGMPKNRIKMELFATNFERTRRKHKLKMASGCSECMVTIILDGSVRVVTIQKNNETILDAALKAGFEPPYSCKSGVCATCRCNIIEGKVEMDRNFSLEDKEIARGFVLSCQSFPVTNKITVDFDQHS